MVPISWTSSDRRDRLPSNWLQLRRAALTRDYNACVLCGEPANQVDHIVPDWAGGPHTLENLRSLCADCHKRKTTEDSAAARKHYRQKATRALPHPLDAWRAD